MDIKTTGKEYRNTFVLSGAFTAIFTAYLAIQNLQSSLNQEQGLGIISLSCMYACIIISGILAPAIIHVFGEKKILVISFICHVIYVGTNFYPTFATLVPSSVLLGLTAGPMWTSQSVYLADMACSYADRTSKDGHAVLSKFNGIFFAMFETTQITGNLISSLVLQQGSYESSSSANETTVKFCGSEDCPMAVNGTKIDEPDRHIVFILLGIFLICDVFGVFLTACFLPPMNKLASKQKVNLLKSLASCGKGLTDLNLVFLLPLIMFMAMEQAILWTDYTKAFISCPLGIQKLGFVMATYGGSTTVFALVFARVSKYTGRYILFALAGLVNLGILITLYIWIPSSEDVFLIFLIPVIWGVAEGIWQIQSNALVALLFPEKKDSAFANYHTWKAIGFTLTFIYGNLLCVSTKLIIAISLLMVSMILYFIVEIRVKQSKSSNEKETEEGNNLDPDSNTSYD
ncbi:protein unc-93 homolog A-like [Mercenaria mercenaria]|uniref:protein unc-93 homolog A-like n=1 Tax=Mercenaria mercenaria TaxID=6596 RepID=UPI00234F815B|nr:protein unc-93 homolog A-like [Mercenaria mercenaria]